MRDPKVVLTNLAEHSHDQVYEYRRIYRNLYNPEFFLRAYRSIYAKEGNMTEGSDGKTIDGMSTERINNIIDQIKDESYQPKPARRTYIPKKNGSKRPLGIPSIDDKLVQEVVRDILTSIYEASFSPNSHGFRPNLSCHTALLQIKHTFVGTKWFVEGDIKSFFDNIDHHVLVALLRKRIKDEKFINLIWKFLKAGYLEDWRFHRTHSGTPQGGIISPILANIYLNELDKYMEEFKEKFDVGKVRRANPNWRYYQGKLYRLKKLHKDTWPSYTRKQKDEIIAYKKELEKLRDPHPFSDAMDSGYKRMQYVRYADDFLIGIIGSKKDADLIKKDVADFLKNRLNLELSQDKTLITHNDSKVRFLGYDIGIVKDNTSKKGKDGTKNKVYNMRPELFVPSGLVRNKLLQLRVLRIKQSGQWSAVHRSEFVNHDDLEIISQYNSEIRGLYEYYKLARNVYSLQSFKYIMEYSMYKTFANKYKSSISKIITKYSINGEFGIVYSTKRGIKTRFLYNEGFKRDLTSSAASLNIDNMQNPFQYSSRGSLIERLLARKCEWCGREDISLEMHHIKKLKDLKGKKTWEKFMIARHRKTIALCKDCHVSLHAGKLD
ncbi:reverse transcriptase domain-containing protein [Paenibacillus sp. GYB004]|uniref:reverse transcriptase/maturase family protein n=1 Tax=Paenibacillus sp. GYB004 TaxID=2994393 RepID=UPI002F964E9A